MLRSMQQGSARSGRAGGKEGKRALGPRAREAVQAAHDQVSAGDHGGAAKAFDALSGIAAERGLHAPAAHFACLAARSHLEAGDAQGALQVARDGLLRTEGAPEKRRLARPFARVWPLLKSADADAAAALLADVRERYGLTSLPPVSEGAAPNRAQRRSLQKACPCCGAATTSLELAFEPDGTLDCPRCGDVLS